MPVQSFFQSIVWQKRPELSGDSLQTCSKTENDCHQDMQNVEDSISLMIRDKMNSSFGRREERTRKRERRKRKGEKGEAFDNLKEIIIIIIIIMVLPHD